MTSGGSEDRNELRNSLRSIWQQALDQGVADDSDFFDLGGHSVAAINICSRVEERHGLRIPIRTLFSHPRFDDYVRAVAAAADSGRA